MKLTDVLDTVDDEELHERVLAELEKEYVNELYELLPENVIRQYSKILQNENNLIPLESDQELTMQDIENNICCMLASEMNYTLLSTSYQYNFMHPNDKEIVILLNSAFFIYRLSQYIEDIPDLREVYENVLEIDNEEYYHLYFEKD